MTGGGCCFRPSVSGEDTMPSAINRNGAAAYATAIPKQGSGGFAASQSKGAPVSAAEVRPSLSGMGAESTPQLGPLRASLLAQGSPQPAQIPVHRLSSRASTASESPQSDEPPATPPVASALDRLGSHPINETPMPPPKPAASSSVQQRQQQQSAVSQTVSQAQSQSALQQQQQQARLMAQLEELLSNQNKMQEHMQNMERDIQHWRRVAEQSREAASRSQGDLSSQTAIIADLKRRNEALEKQANNIARVGNVALARRAIDEANLSQLAEKDKQIDDLRLELSLMRESLTAGVPLGVSLNTALPPQHKGRTGRAESRSSDGGGVRVSCPQLKGTYTTPSRAGSAGGGSAAAVNISADHAASVAAVNAAAAAVANSPTAAADGAAVAALQAAVADLTAKAEQLQGQAEQLAAEKAALAAEAAALARQRDEALTQVPQIAGALQEQLSHLSGKYKEVLELVAAKQRQLEAKDAEVKKQLDAKDAEVRRAVEAKEAEAKAVKGRFAELESKLAASEKQTWYLKCKLATLTGSKNPGSIKTEG